jgi:hypothetical protein
MDESRFGVYIAEVKKFVDIIDILCNNRLMAGNIYYSKNDRKEVNGLHSDNGRGKRKLKRKGGAGICQKGCGD